MADEDVPVYPTIASQFNDPGVTWMFVNLCRLMREKLGVGAASAATAVNWNPTSTPRCANPAPPS